MKSTLLCPCFSLPKLSSFIRTCNLVPLIPLYESFDSVIFSFLSDSLGAHLLSWFWLKASLPVSMGGLRLWKVAVDSAAAYYASLCCSASILEDVLGSTPILAPFLDACCPLLSLSAARPEWISH